MVVSSSGVYYWDTYAPVISWLSVRILITMSKIHNLHTKSVDFLQAYLQEPVKHNIYLRSPDEVMLNNDNGNMTLELLKNLYRLRYVALV